YRQSCPTCPKRLGGPQQVYEVALQHMVGWQAVDYARQRYGLKGGAYGRERHHRQIVRAVMAQLIKQDLVLNPAKDGRVLQAVGKGVIFDGHGRTPSDFGCAVLPLRPENITMIGLPGGSVYSGGTYVEEALNKSVND